MNKIINSKISVITVCYNAVNDIEKTILSVVNQKYDNIEYIIVDGGSTDGTLDVIKKYQYYIAKFVSEKDEGIYDAMNKGMRLATGEWIVYLNAGDFFFESESLYNVFNNKTFPGIDVIYGDMACIQRTGIYKETLLDLKLFNVTFPIKHPASFVRRDTILKYKFDTSYRISADFNQFRQMYFSGAKFLYVPQMISVFDNMSGISSTNVMQNFIEIGRVIGENKLRMWKLKIVLQYLRYQMRKLINILCPQLLHFLEKRRYSNNEKIELKNYEN